MRYSPSLHQAGGSDGILCILWSQHLISFKGKQVTSKKLSYTSSPLQKKAEAVRAAQRLNIQNLLTLSKQSPFLSLSKSKKNFSKYVNIKGFTMSQLILLLNVGYLFKISMRLYLKNHALFANELL